MLSCSKKQFVEQYQHVTDGHRDKHTELLCQYHVLQGCTTLTYNKNKNKTSVTVHIQHCVASIFYG